MENQLCRRTPLVTSWFSINFFFVKFLFSLTPLNLTIYSNLLILVVNIVCQTTYELNQIDRVLTVIQSTWKCEIRSIEFKYFDKQFYLIIINGPFFVAHQISNTICPVWQSTVTCATKLIQPRAHVYHFGDAFYVHSLAGYIVIVLMFSDGDSLACPSHKN